MKSDESKMVCSILELHGIKYEVTQNRHINVYFERDGKRHRIVCAISPSDHRAHMNMFFRVRKILREVGVEFREESKSLLRK